MGDPTNRNDPDYSSRPGWVFGADGRWHAPNNPNLAPPTPGESVTASTVPITGPEQPPNSREDQFWRESGNINNFAGYNTLNPYFMANAAQQTAANPYNTQTADRSRAGQLALFQQMQNAKAGPSVAAMQAGGAQGQNVQAALGAGRGGAVGRMAAGAAGGMGSAAGQAVLAEQLRASQGAGGLAGSLRGSDIKSAGLQSASGLAAQGQADARSMSMAQLGAQLNQARARKALEDFKTGRRIGNADKKTTEKIVMDGFDSLATWLGSMG